MNEMSGYRIEDLRPGMQARFSKTITEADIVLFAGVSGEKPSRARPRSNRRGSPPVRPRADYYLDADLFQAVPELIKALC